jgi:hypothetical protein
VPFKTAGFLKAVEHPNGYFGNMERLDKSLENRDKA